MSQMRSLEFYFKNYHIHGFSMGFIDNSEVAYFLLDHHVYCRSNDLGSSLWHWHHGM